MQDRRPRRHSCDLELRIALDRPASEAFAALTGRLTDGFSRAGLMIEPHSGGALRDTGERFGEVRRWGPDREIVLEARPVAWGTSPTVTVRLRVEEAEGGSMLSVEVDGWAATLGAAGGGLVDWYEGTLVPEILRLIAPSRLADWVTDRRARRPSGEEAVATYRDPTYHWPNFLLILDRVKLSASDRLLEVGCGGGAFLHRALDSGCTALGIDHSPDMIRLAREVNREAIESGRLEVLQGEAEHLPAPDASFTCCVCTGAFNFFPDPSRALREMHRTLVPGGRLAIFTASEALKGTPAAPEPLASRLRFYSSEELARLARDAGFPDARVESPEMEGYARQAGLPQDVVEFFRGPGGGQLLLAKRAGPGTGPVPTRT